MSAPRLRAALLRVRDVQAEARFYAERLGCAVRPAGIADWLELEVGWEQSLLLAPGGRTLTPIADRWEQQGYIPILKTRDVDREANALDSAGVGWANRMLEYDMRGHGRLAYFLDPEHHPIGMQQRMADTARDEDLVTNHRLDIDPAAATRWLGIGWLICQVVDLHATRDFYRDAVGWPVERGTEGFGYMHRIDPYTMLQTAFRGRVLDAPRDLSADDVLPVLSAPDPDRLLASVRAGGGVVFDGPCGSAAFADPEGHAWLVMNEAIQMEDPA